MHFYASPFRRQRHYVFGLSVRPSVRTYVRPYVRSPKYLLSTSTWRHISDALRWVLSSFLINIWISLKISLKFLPEARIKNIPALVQIMALCLFGTKPLSELMMVSLLMHICVTQPQWVKFGSKEVEHLTYVDAMYNSKKQNELRFYTDIIKLVMTDKLRQLAVTKYFTDACSLKCYPWTKRIWVL